MQERTTERTPLDDLAPRTVQTRRSAGDVPAPHLVDVPSVDHRPPPDSGGRSAVTAPDGARDDTEQGDDSTQAPTPLTNTAARSESSPRSSSTA